MPVNAFSSDCKSDLLSGSGSAQTGFAATRCGKGWGPIGGSLELEFRVSSLEAKSFFYRIGVRVASGDVRLDIDPPDTCLL